jgi:hypothetical protein
MTKTLIISAVTIIVVVQAQAPRALLQSVPNKKSLHMLLLDLSSCSWWWCQGGGGVCGWGAGEFHLHPSEVLIWFHDCFVF